MKGEEILAPIKTVEERTVGFNMSIIRSVNEVIPLDEKKLDQLITKWKKDPSSLVFSERLLITKILEEVHFQGDRQTTVISSNHVVVR